MTNEKKRLNLVIPMKLHKDFIRKIAKEYKLQNVKIVELIYKYVIGEIK